MVTPLEVYREKIAAGSITADEEQERVVRYLQDLFEAIVSAQIKGNERKTFLSAWFNSKETRSPKIKGLYLWGGVGRGKTFLMDLFYDCLPVSKKQRTHFHRFMQSVHKELTQLQGHKNPLEILAEKIADSAQLLCFDEFFVIDIADAMILAGLFEELFKRDVILVATSNIFPDGLYENGLQRKSFLPAIELIKLHTDVVEIRSVTDYRLRSLSQANLYLTPLGPGTEALLETQFSNFTQGKSCSATGSEIVILDRVIKAKKAHGDVVWFDFAQLCDGPRSAFDYIEIAKLFHTLLLSDVPQMNEAKNDSARRFVSLIDELYDRKVKLVVSAEVEITALYTGTGLAFAFERTASRLLEMQSHEYLCMAHLA